jgi:MFS family permease
MLTIFLWSQLSDHIGRKPVILTALSAISLSMVLFGLSKTFLGLVVSRAVCGIFDGSGAVIKSTVMDITDATNLPNAYSYTPIPWHVGKIIGPLIGGSLSRPADRFPDIFGRSELLKTYPYLLPCSISTILVLIAWLIVYFRLKETVFTRPLWELIKGGFSRQSYAQPHQPSSNVLVNPGEVQPKPLPLRALLTSKVLIVTASSATMALFQTALSSLQPVFYATPIELGGLSLDPPRIGAILAAQGATFAIIQLVFFARLHDRFGARAIHLTCLSSGIPTIILLPVINFLARAHGTGLAVWLCVAIQLVLAMSLLMCYPSLTLFVRASTPNRASLGATNGIVQMFVSAAMIIGSGSANSVFSYSMREGHDAWLAYYFLTATLFLAIGTSLLLPRDPSVWEDHH